MRWNDGISMFILCLANWSHHNCWQKRQRIHDAKYKYRNNPILCKILRAAVPPSRPHSSWMAQWWWSYQSSNGSISIVNHKTVTTFKWTQPPHTTHTFSSVREHDSHSSHLHRAPAKWTALWFNWFSICSWVPFNCWHWLCDYTATSGFHDSKFKSPLNSVGIIMHGEITLGAFVKDASRWS